MSGGHFEYHQFTMHIVASMVDDLLKDSFYESYSVQTKTYLLEAAQTLRLAASMVHLIDWLVSGEEDEEVFLYRWNIEIEQLKREINERI